jgi:hypothetical protein
VIEGKTWWLEGAQSHWLGTHESVLELSTTHQNGFLRVRKDRECPYVHYYELYYDFYYYPVYFFLVRRVRC